MRYDNQDPPRSSAPAAAYGSPITFQMPFGWKLLTTIRTRLESDPKTTPEMRKLIQNSWACESTINYFVPGIVDHIREHLVDYLRASLRERYGHDFRAEVKVTNVDYDLDLHITLRCRYAHEWEDEAAIHSFLAAICGRATENSSVMGGLLSLPPRRS